MCVCESSSGGDADMCSDVGGFCGGGVGGCNNVDGAVVWVRVVVVMWIGGVVVMWVGVIMWMDVVVWVVVWMVVVV